MDEKINLSQESTSLDTTPPPIFVVSGGLGLTGEQIVRTTLTQFQDTDVPVRIIGHVETIEHLEQIVDEVAKNGGAIVHTLYNPQLQFALADLARKRHVKIIDLVSPLLNYLTDMLNQQPLGQAGLYRQQHESYFRRTEAIEFTLACDDGMNYRDWPKAEIMLVGVSRVGKTPISLYLAILGWKVANLPLVPDMPPRPELFDLDHRRVVGLMVDPTQLLLHREHRQKRLGVSTRSDYVDLEKLYEEVELARKVFRRGGFRVVDVTNQPIESTADRIITLITRQLGEEAHLEQG